MGKEILQRRVAGQTIERVQSIGGDSANIIQLLTQQRVSERNPACEIDGGVEV